MAACITTIVLFFVLVIGGAAIFYNTWFGELSDIFCGGLIGLLIWLLMVLLPIGCVGSGITMDLERCEANGEETAITICAMKDNISAEGYHYYRGGYIDEELYYYYTYQTDKGMAQGKVKAENTYIVIDPEVEEATLIIRTTEVKDGFYAGLEGPNECVFILPEDKASVITDEYIIDLE